MAIQWFIKMHIHKAIILGQDRYDSDVACIQRSKVKLCDLREPNIDCLRYNLGT